MRQAVSEQDKSAVSTVEEKVHLENHLPYEPGRKTGPTVELYFHELTSRKNAPQRLLKLVGTLFLSLIFLATFPLIAILIKLFSEEPVIKKTTVPGKRGIVFQQYSYPTEAISFLQKTGAYKLPSVINIWKGQMNLVGPKAYPANDCNRWNNELSDFYKRFALPPGYFSVSEPVGNTKDLETIEKSLKQELDYILAPTLKKDLRHLFNQR